MEIAFAENSFQIGMSVVESLLFCVIVDGEKFLNLGGDTLAASFGGFIFGFGGFLGHKIIVSATS